MLEKVFELEDWEAAYVENLYEETQPQEPVVEIRFGRETITVTRDALDALSEAIIGMSSRPPIFYNCKQVFNAIVKILGKDPLEYAMPQTEADLEEFDWSQVDYNDSKTFPKGQSPQSNDFAKFARDRLQLGKGTKEQSGTGSRATKCRNPI
jgi:hypothetical protein